MKSSHLTRRQFFQASVLGVGALALPALGLASTVAAPSREAQAAAEQPDGPAIPQPTFNPIASNTTFGPLTDISMGWDGTLWGIDAQGAPHVYDSINDAWAQHGDGIDAAAQLGDLLYFFSGDSFVTASQSQLLQMSAVQTIAAQWPALPNSFKLGVMGAANFNDKGLILFNGGRFVSTDGSIPLTALTSLVNWPQTPQWQAGVIDAVYCTGVNQLIILIRGAQFIRVDPVAKLVVSQPAPLTTLSPLNTYFPPTWMTSGFDAGAVAGNYQIAFKGTAMVIQINGAGSAAQPQYIAAFFSKGWPATWHPVLQHAPNGRDGNLWSVLPQAQGGWIMQHNGESWQQVPNQADHVGVGQDNAVMIASAQRLWTFTGAFDGSGFTPVSQPSNLIQVSLGHSNAVNARDSNGVVYNFNPTTGGLTQNAALGAVTHIATGNDGTLWHCKPNDNALHRYLSDAAVLQPGITIKQGIVNSVQVVAAVGFGAAHCLVQQTGQTQAYRYDSPYVFKTTSTYSATTRGPLAVGIGMVYITAVQDFTNPQPQERTFLVAIDAHTGAEVSRSAVRSSDTQTTYGLTTFDPVNNLIYVGTNDFFHGNNNTTAGQLLALDARDLSKVVWSYTTPASIDGKPVVVGTSLLFGDRTGTLYRFDTTAALAQASNPKPTWTWKPSIGPADTYRVSPPLLSDGKVITAFWSLSSASKHAWFGSCNIGDGSDPFTFDAHTVINPGSIDPYYLLTQPVAGEVVFAQPPGYTAPGYYFNGGDAIFTVGPGEGTTFLLPAGTAITTGLNYDADTQTLWFSAGSVLYALNKNLSPVSHTPFTFDGGPNRLIYSRPVIYTDPKGGKTILTGLFDESAMSGNLYGFDPDNGNVASIQTGVTLITALSEDVTNGVVYASGTLAALSSAKGFSQVFGLRVDALPQELRDFVIESQLMQDPDPSQGNATTPSPSGPIPPSVARYQTHLTVVDDGKRPLPNEPVKIWADTPNTIITVNGAQYTIGPDDASFASIQTGVDGAVVIRINATDVNASTLRVWASFMDPYERMVIYPDHEFHQRVSNTINDANAKPDPGTPNLNLVTNYKGDSLFTSAQKNNGDPDKVGQAIGQMRNAVNPAPTTPASLAGALKTLHASSSASPYAAYTDLAGMHYGPNNARLKRAVQISSAAGLQFSKDPSGKVTYAQMHHADARNAIDALTGNAWDPNNPDGPGIPQAEGVTAPTHRFAVRVSQNVWTDFWNWLKGAFAKIEQVIVSVAEDVLVAIQTAAGTVFKALITVLDDICPALGSFFKMLETLIDDVIEALSVLLQFEEIVNTQRWLQGQFDGLVADFKSAVATTLRPKVDSFFDAGEDAIKSAFDGLRSQLTPNQSIGGMKGAGSTAHTAMSAGPGTYGQGSNSSSHAVQGSWGMQKMKEGLPLAKSSAEHIRRVGGDPLTDFLDNFIASISNNGPLADTFDQLKSDISRLFSPTSLTQFFTTLLTTLIDALETLLIGALAVGQAFFDGILGSDTQPGLIGDAIDAISQVANAEIDVPVLSWLYQLLFGQPLTLLNMVTLVAAIPVTVIYRVVEGQYPSEALGAGNAKDAPDGINRVQRAEYNVVASKILGTFSGFFSFEYAGFSAMSDADGSTLGAEGAYALSFINTIVSFPLIYSDASDVSPSDWATYGISASLSIVFGLISGAATAGGQLLSSIGAGLYSVLLMGVIVSYIRDGASDLSANLGVSAGILGALPGILNPLKFNNPIGLVIVVAADMAFNLAVCALTIASVFEKKVAGPNIRRLYFPWAPFMAPRTATSPAPSQAQPHLPALGGAMP